MTTAYTYRAGSANTRQVEVTIDCRVVSLERFVGVQIYEAMPGFYLGAGDGLTLTEPQREWLLYGLEEVSEDFFETTDRYDVVVEITRLDDDADHPAASAFAVAGWVARAYGLDYTPPNPAYDAEQNRLVYKFDGPM